MTTPEAGEYRSPYTDHQHLDGDVYRAVYPAYFDWITYEEGGSRAVDKRAFTAMSEAEAQGRGYEGRAMSVGLVAKLNEHFGDIGDGIDEFLIRAEKIGWGVVRLRAPDIRAVIPPLGLCEDPVPTQPWHALVFPVDRGNINKNSQSQLADCCELVRPPEG